MHLLLPKAVVTKVPAVGARPNQDQGRERGAHVTEPTLLGRQGRIRDPLPRQLCSRWNPAGDDLGGAP